MTKPSRDPTARAFSERAEAYAESLPHARDRDLDIVADFAGAGAEDLCLDIATGPGHTAFKLAERGATIVGVDAAAGMIRTARRLAAERGAERVSFLVADAGALPFDGGTFSHAACRIAAHHFADLAQALRETHRVLRPGGRLVIEDSLAPDDPELADFLERLEKRRDRTHVHSLSAMEWEEALGAAGFAVAQRTVFHKTQAFDAWVRRTGLGVDEVQAIVRDLLHAPARIRDPLLTVEEDRIQSLHDRKIILRADKRPDRSDPRAGA